MLAADHSRDGIVGGIADVAEIHRAQAEIYRTRAEKAEAALAERDTLATEAREALIEAYKTQGTFEKYEETMKRWDYIRRLISSGDKSSTPRDIFEDIISGYFEATWDIWKGAEKAEALGKRLAEHLFWFPPITNDPGVKTLTYDLIRDARALGWLAEEKS